MCHNVQGQTMRLIDFPLFLKRYNKVYKYSTVQYKSTSAGILEQSTGARNRVFVPARQPM
jgi:hypothetical protein